MLYRFGQVSNRGQSTCGTPPKQCQTLSGAAAQSLAQEIGKQWVVSEPFTRIIERNQQGIEMAELLEQ
ncbi:hypothetical protein, partial [Staphylococcus aureus]